MAILRATLLSFLAACYSPDLADCTVTCASDEDCASGQQCSDRVCSRAGVSCAGGEPISGDAAVVVPKDAPPEPDGPTTEQGVLRVRVADQGVVHVPGHQDCDSDVTSECMYVVDLAVPITLTAEPHDDRYFDKWEESPVCMGVTEPSCTVTPTVFETRITAKFRKID